MLAWLSHLIRRPLPAGLVEDGSAFADGTIELRRLPDAALDEIDRARKEGFHVVRLEPRSNHRFAATLVRPSS